MTMSDSQRVNYDFSPNERNFGRRHFVTTPMTHMTRTGDNMNKTRVYQLRGLVFLGLSVLDLGPMYAKDRQTSDAHHHLMPLPYGAGAYLNIHSVAYRNVAVNFWQ